MNTCYNALDRHIEAGHGEQLALIYDSPITNTLQKFTYQQLLDEVKRTPLLSCLTKASSSRIPYSLVNS